MQVRARALVVGLFTAVASLNFALLLTVPGCCSLSPAMSNAIKGVIMEVKRTDEHSIGDELSLPAALCAPLALLTGLVAVLVCPCCVRAAARLRLPCSDFDHRHDRLQDRLQ